MAKRSKKAKQIRKALRQARALITPLEHWTTQTEARNLQGGKVGTRDKAAAKFCAVGSVHFIVWESPDFKDLPENEKNELLRATVKVLDGCAVERRYTSIVNLNDSLGAVTRVERHNLVLDAFDCAVEKAEVMYPDTPPVEMRPQASATVGSNF